MSSFFSLSYRYAQVHDTSPNENEKGKREKSSEHQEHGNTTLNISSKRGAKRKNDGRIYHEKSRKRRKKNGVSVCGFTNNPVNTWNNGNVIQWLSIVDLGSKRSEYLSSFLSQNTTGADLLEMAAHGTDKFVMEMKENHKVTSVIARRMFKSLLKHSTR